MAVGAVKRTATGGASHPMLSGNTFECLVQLEEECLSEVDKNVEESRLDPNACAEFSDTSPTFDTFKPVNRIGELDFTPVTLSKKKLKKLKKKKFLFPSRFQMKWDLDTYPMVKFAAWT